MVEFFSSFLIAVALSMDTFSLSLGVGTYNINKKDCFKLSLIVGIMHFIMPTIGSLLGNSIVSFFALNSNKLLGGILLFLAINLLINLNKEEDIEIDLSYLGMFLFAFGVSIDAFSTGLGLDAITNNKIFTMLIFTVTSFSFTLLGLLIGKFAKELVGKKASIVGFLLLICLGVYHLFI